MDTDQTSPTGPADEQRLRAIQAVETLRIEIELLEDALHTEGAAATNVVMALLSGLSVSEIMRDAPIANARIRLTERGIAFDAARKAARHAMVALLIAEDFTIAQIAEVFGVSRQLASRLVHEVQASETGGTDAGVEEPIARP
jgi:CRP-like cAMP-binding protein